MSNRCYRCHENMTEAEFDHHDLCKACRSVRRGSGTSLLARDQAAKAAHRSGGPRAGVRAYCAGNRWATENAKGVGNW
jgi:hypothetical protein